MEHILKKMLKATFPAFIRLALVAAVSCVLMTVLGDIFRDEIYYYFLIGATICFAIEACLPERFIDKTFFNSMPSVLFFISLFLSAFVCLYLIFDRSSYSMPLWLTAITAALFCIAFAIIRKHSNPNLGGNGKLSKITHTIACFSVAFFIFLTEDAGGIQNLFETSYVKDNLFRLIVVAIFSLIFWSIAVSIVKHAFFPDEPSTPKKLREPSRFSMVISSLFGSRSPRTRIYSRTKEYSYDTTIYLGCSTTNQIILYGPAWKSFDDNTKLENPTTCKIINMPDSGPYKAKLYSDRLNNLQYSFNRSSYQAIFRDYMYVYDGLGISVCLKASTIGVKYDNSGKITFYLTQDNPMDFYL